MPKGRKIPSELGKGMPIKISIKRWSFLKERGYIDRRRNSRKGTEVEVGRLSGGIGNKPIILSEGLLPGWWSQVKVTPSFPSAGETVEGSLKIPQSWATCLKKAGKCTDMEKRGI